MAARTVYQQDISSSVSAEATTHRLYLFILFQPIINPHVQRECRIRQTGFIVSPLVKLLNMTVHLFVLSAVAVSVLCVLWEAKRKL